MLSWDEPDGRPGHLDVFVALPTGHESLNVVIPWCDTVFNLTSKHQARPAEGRLTVATRSWSIGGSEGPESWDEPMRPWHIEDPGGQLDMVLTPRFDKHSHADAGEFGIETHQAFGEWSGHLATDDGLDLDFSNLQGFAEEARQRW